MRHLITFASAISLLLCAATVVQWVRRDGLVYDAAGKVFGARVGVTSLDARIIVSVSTPFPGTVGEHFTVKSMADEAGDESDTVVELNREAWSIAGVWIARGREMHESGRFKAAPFQSRFVIVRLEPALATGMFMIGGLYFPLVVLSALRRKPEGRCPVCSYSLTGNTSGTCPECGTPIPQAHRPA